MRQFEGIDEVETITGGDMIEHDAPFIAYVVKCKICRSIEPEKHTTSLTKGVTEVITVKCFKCGHTQMVKIRYPKKVE